MARTARQAQVFIAPAPVRSIHFEADYFDLPHGGDGITQDTFGRLSRQAGVRREMGTRYLQG